LVVDDICSIENFITDSPVTIPQYFRELNGVVDWFTVTSINDSLAKLARVTLMDLLLERLQRLKLRHAEFLLTVTQRTEDDYLI
jgi:hypothetical protein